MEKRTYHGPITPKDFARALIAELDQGGLRVRQVGRGGNLVIQVASPESPASGGRTALAIHLSKVEDGVLVSLGQQEWLGLAASLGKTALSTLLNPSSLVHRLDDIAQDINLLQLSDRIWDTLGRVADNLGASHEISERLRRLVCQYCHTANPVGEPSCIACGAPLGYAQPATCVKCGYVVSAETRFCPNCGQALK